MFVLFLCFLLKGPRGQRKGSNSVPDGSGPHVPAAASSAQLDKHPTQLTREAARASRVCKATEA